MFKRSENAGRPRAFRASRLHVSDIPGTVQIRVAEREGMSVQITGPRHLAEQIECWVSGGVLYVSGPQGGGSAAAVANTGVQVNSFGVRGGMVVRNTGAAVATGGGIANSGIILGDVGMGHGTPPSEPEAVHVVIEAPRGAPVEIEDGVGGAYTVEDTEGPLDLRMTAAGGVTAGRVGATHVSIKGSAVVEISAVNGDALDVSNQASGQVTVRDGRVDHLVMRAHASGDAVFGGVARSAELLTTGSGGIRVNHVTGWLDKRSMGSGQILVHIEPPRDPGTFWG